MKDEVLLFTSGLDSYIAREYLVKEGHDIDCLYFDHGGMYCQNELRKIQNLPYDVKVSTDLNFAGIEEPDAHIPNRNIIMTVMAQAYGYKKVWLGGSLSDRVGDNRSDVFAHLSKMLSSVNEEYCSIDSPFYHCYKDDMVRWFASNFPTSRMDLARNTFSCFSPLKEEREVKFYVQGAPGRLDTYECLNCPACFRKCAVMWSGDIYVHFENNEIRAKYEKQFIHPVLPNARTIGTMKYIDRWFEELDASKEK